MKRELFDRVCSGVSVRAAERALGVSHGVGHQWWRRAGGMTLATGQRGGIAGVVEGAAPGGRGHRISLGERVEIMRGLDNGDSYAEIGRRIGRHAPEYLTGNFVRAVKSLPYTID